MPPRKKNPQPRQWRRIELHLHTPASIDYKQPGVTYLDLLKKAEEKDLDVVAFTDHNTAAGYEHYLEEVESLELLERLNRLRDDERQRLGEYRRLREKILILPGFEFTATLGFHILGIFPPDTSVRELEHLLLSMRIPADKLDQGSGEVGATTDALTAYRMINEAGGLVIAAHANSSHGVAMPGFDFGGQTRIAYTQDPNLHALEVTDLDSKSRRRTAAFFSGTKPEYPRRMHCIQGSDAHKLAFDARYKNEMGVGDRATEMLLDDLTFEDIKGIFLGNDFARTRPYRPATEEPYDPIRDAREQGDTLVQAFHERLHEKRGIARSVLEDVAALANTNGGTIYIGASSNLKTPAVGVERPEQASLELRGAVSKEITPPLEVQIDVVKSLGKSILQVIVPRGSEAPYALEGSYIYVRSENETGLAMRDEIVQLVREALAVEMAAALPAAPPTVEKRAPEETGVAAEPVQPAVPGVLLPAEPPRTGVEIVSFEMRKGITYYSVKDLRNMRIVQNVTRSSARRLWQYAIEEQEKNPCVPEKMEWVGNIGICKSHKRGGKTRYDLAQRVGDRVLVYYGVTEDGIHGPWRKLVETEAGGEAEEGAEIEAQKLPSGPASIISEFGEAPEAEQTSMAVESAEPADVSPNGKAEAIEESVSIPESVGSGPSNIQAPSYRSAEWSEIEPEGESREQLPTPEEGMAPELEPIDTGESSIPAQEEAVSEMEQAKPEEQRSPMEEHAPEPVLLTPPAQAIPEPRHEAVQPPIPQPSAPKTKAQEWREKLDRAMAEARAAQEAAKNQKV